MVAYLRRVIVAGLGLLAGQACFVSVDEFPTGEGTVGQRCNAEEPCKIDLDCLGVDAQPFGIAGGLCTRDCGSDVDCPTGSRCVMGVGFGTCLQSCTIGDADAEKCHGRRDAGCTRIPISGITVDVCVPVCNDSDCGSRFCDRQSGSCVDQPVVGDPVATECTDHADCRGSCTGGICEERCVIGGPDVCANSAVGTKIECIVVDGIQESPDLGDVWICMRECECDADCGGIGDEAGVICNEVRDGQKYCGARSPGELGTDCPEQL